MHVCSGHRAVKQTVLQHQLIGWVQSWHILADQGLSVAKLMDVLHNQLLCQVCHVTLVMCLLYLGNSLIAHVSCVVGLGKQKE